MNFCGTVTSDSSPCAFLVFACLIELHRTRGTRSDVAVFATLLRLRGHCLAPANAEATAHCAQPPISVKIAWLTGQAAVGNVLASEPVRLSQRRLSDIAATLTTMPSCAGTPAWDPGSDNHRGQRRPLRHCASEGGSEPPTPTVRLACLCDSVRLGARVGGDDSPAE